MTIEQQIKAVKDALAEKNKAFAARMAEPIEKGVTPDEEQETAIQAIEAEIEVLEKNLKRLEKLKESAEKAAQTAVPAQGQTPEEGQKSSAGIVKAKNLPNLEKGIGYAQFVRAKLLSQLEAKKGNFISPVQAAESLGFNDDVVKFTESMTKAVLGSTTDAGFAKPLVEPQTYTADFLEMLRNATVFNKLNGYRSVPFNVKINGQLTGGTAQWVGEGKAKPLTNPTFGSVDIKEHKLAAITVYTQELMRRADPAIDSLVRDDLVAASAELIDKTFLDAIAGDGNRPAGVLNGAGKVVSTGTTAEKYQADFMSLIGKFVDANLSTDNSYFLMSETLAMQLALLRDALGNSYFHGMNFAGSRSLLGIPVITSKSIGNKVILVKMSEILVAQDGGVDVSYSDQATLVDGATTHNLWQENKFAVRVEKFITWAKRRPIAAAYLDYA